MADSGEVLRVLVIEDDASLRDVLRNALADTPGWTVHAACDPEEARRYYAVVDVVMSDWQMPNGGGERVLRESPAPVLIYSSDPSAIAHPNRLKKPATLPAIQYAIVAVARPL